MQFRAWSLLITGGAVVAAIVRLSAKARRPMAVAPSIDLSRYTGKWYEIARLPNRFQKKCAGDTTATYGLRPDGKFWVLNQCRLPDGRIESIPGTARLADPTGPNTKWKVSFRWPFSGDYWIIDVDVDYRWALVGEPGRKYLWILSRQPHLDERIQNRLLERAKQEGYKVGNILRTPQSDLTPAGQF